MGMLSLADILLTDAQVSYKENRIILYFKSDAEVNPIFKEHVRSLYAKFVKQESVSVTIGEHPLNLILFHWPVLRLRRNMYRTIPLNGLCAVMNLPLQLKTMVISQRIPRNRGYQKPALHL